MPCDFIFPMNSVLRAVVAELTRVLTLGLLCGALSSALLPTIVATFLHPPHLNVFCSIKFFDVCLQKQLIGTGTLYARRSGVGVETLLT